MNPNGQIALVLLFLVLIACTVAFVAKITIAQLAPILLGSRRRRKAQKEPAPAPTKTATEATAESAV